MTMNLFNRLEVWLLLILAAGATLFVVWPKSDNKSLINDVQPARPESKLSLLGCKIERDFGNARLDLEVRLTNRHARKLMLVAPAVRLLNAQGKNVPDFILPAEHPPEVPPNAEATVILRYWLEQNDLNGKLTLEADGASVEVKSEKPLDLAQLKNGEPTRLP